MIWKKQPIEKQIATLNSNITPSTVSVSPTYNSNIHNTELTLRTIGKLVTGHLVFSYNSSFAGGDGNQEIITNNNGLPPASVANQMFITCIAGNSAGQTGRVRVTANGHLQFYYSNVRGSAGESYLVSFNYITT